ncbi:hypothetical protein OGAPHI_004298 [Ogataea philodendri]|uniref:Uncharacterized protein n=1 Tax=Ogataea philodendri TaxID=1378263 RepID=A0A9P8T5A4_9ASCO|nr:uncharacterized protein OGAPHI_004298 [Ogataea philodendri]KAH3666109.1 hypothetical protein OGAPHI_004298 [Ogataea philodendri]
MERFQRLEICWTQLLKERCGAWTFDPVLKHMGNIKDTTIGSDPIVRLYMGLSLVQDWHRVACKRDHCSIQLGMEICERRCCQGGIARVGLDPFGQLQ